MTSRFLQLGLPLVLLLAAPVAEEVELRFLPEEEQTLRLTFESYQEMEVTDVEASVVVNGEEQDTSGADVELTQSNEERLVFVDEILGVDGPRILKLRRTFEEIERTEEYEVGPPVDDSGDREGESDLEGTSVIFTWDADEEEYTVAFDEGEDGDEDLLDELELGVHLTPFLPDRAVDVGDTWELDASAFDEVASTGGDLHILYDGEEDDDGVNDQIEDNLEGVVRCELLEIVEEGDARYAVIGVRVEASSWATDDGSEDREGMSMTYNVDTELELELEGEVRWNLGANRASSMQLEGDMVIETDTTREFSGQVEAEMEEQRTMEGTLSLSAEIE